MRRGLDISKLLHQCWIDVRNAALLLVMPWRLSVAAQRTSLPGAIALSLGALIVEASMFAAVLLTRFDLDRTSLSALFLDAAGLFRSILPYVAIAFTVLLVPALLVILLVRRAGTASLNVFILTPACFVLMVLTWSVVALLASHIVGDFGVANPCIWLPLGAIVAVGLHVHALTALDVIAARRPMHCPQCQYPLKGLRSGRCPECGELCEPGGGGAAR